MGIDAKDVGVFVWKIFRFSGKSIFRCVKKYPVVSCVSMFIFFLYVVLPSVFYFLLYSFPIFASAAFYFRNHLSLKPLKINNIHMSEEKRLSGKVRNEKPCLRHQRSVRRNARRKVEEVGKDWDSSQASEDEKDKVILATLYGELPSKSTEDFKEIMKEKTLLVSEESSFEHMGGDSSSCNTEPLVTDPLEKVTCGGIETEVESLEDDEEEEEEEEEIRDNRNKAVEWTEDDQKNLMDLGISEIERNKRLENLITRRRTRRLILLATERNLMDVDIPPISVGRDYFGLHEIDGLQMPGSAPSVLLPTRNPFDLPYDPQEEKPNLMGDSFQQEFAVANQKDFMFCRHESFCRGHFPSENLQNAKWAIDGLGFTGLRPKQDVPINEHLVEQQQPLTKENHLANGADMKKGDGCRIEGDNNLTEKEMGNSPDVEFHTETDSIRNGDSESNSSLSPRHSEKEFNLVNQPDVSGDISGRNGERKDSMGFGDQIRNSVAGLAAPRHNNSSSLAAERQRYMEHFGYNARKGHMVTHSMESDLQVEVSEIGSPPTTVDGNDSSEDENSSSVYESENETLERLHAQIPSEQKISYKELHVAEQPVVVNAEVSG